MKVYEFLLNKATILEYVKQEEIFSFYLKEDVNTIDKYRNITRKGDEHPSCFFRYSEKTKVLHFYDKADVNLDCFSFVQKLFKISYRKALVKIYEDIVIGLNKEKLPIDDSDEEGEFESKKNTNTLKIKSRDFSKWELKKWIKGGIDVTQKKLNDFGIYATETIWENNYVLDNLKNTFTYIEYGTVTQVYFPLAKNTNRRRFISVLSHLGNLNNIPVKGELLVITKSKKDCFYLSLFGIPSVYIMNESITLESSLFEKLKQRFPHIVFLFDNDRAGKRCAVRHRQKYNKEVFVFVPKGKDFTEYLDIEGFEIIDQNIKEWKKKFMP